MWQTRTCCASIIVCVNPLVVVVRRRRWRRRRGTGLATFCVVQRAIDSELPLLRTRACADTDTNICCCATTSSRTNLVSAQCAATAHTHNIPTQHAHHSCSCCLLTLYSIRISSSSASDTHYTRDVNVHDAAAAVFAEPFNYRFPFQGSHAAAAALSAHPPRQRIDASTTQRQRTCCFSHRCV